MYLWKYETFYDVVEGFTIQHKSKAREKYQAMEQYDYEKENAN